jgi:hypothetical protein
MSCELGQRTYGIQRSETGKMQLPLSKAKPLSLGQTDESRLSLGQRLDSGNCSAH